MVHRRWSASVVLVATLISMTGTPPLRAERLPLRHYTTVDGLSGDYVIDVFGDSRGFLWLSTRDGVSRFDGVVFRSYGVADGLPVSTVNGVIQTRDGTYWIATNGGGICRFEPDSRPNMVAQQVGPSSATNRVNVMFEDRRGRLWVGTDDGAFMRDGTRADGPFESVALGLPDDANRRGVHGMTEGPDGSLWFVGGFGLRRRLPDGRLVHYRIEPYGPRDSATSVLVASTGEVWVGFRRGLLRFAPRPLSDMAAQTAPLERVFQFATPPGGDTEQWLLGADGLPSDVITALSETLDGHMWVGTTGGLAEVTTSEVTATVVRAYRPANGLPDALVTDIEVDNAGNLWVGTVAGAARIVRHGLVTYTEADGLVDVRIRSLGEEPDGTLVVVSGDYGVSRFDGRRFDSVRVPMLSTSICNWMSPCGYVDKSGGWWMLTTTGTYFWPRPVQLKDLKQPAASTFGLDGITATDVFSAFADSHARVWIGGTLGGISRWDPAQQRWQSFSDAEGLPARGSLGARPTAFAEDVDGNIWVGFEGAGLMRWKEGRFERVGLPDRPGLTSITTLYGDRAGRLWVGSSQGGLGRIDDRSAAPVSVRSLTMADGLASNNVRTLVEDRQGRLYAGTSRGVDRLVPDTGEVTHYTVSEGLGSQFVTTSFRDRAGALWFGTVSGLSRLDVPEEAGVVNTDVPQTFVSGVRVSGVSRPLSELGEVTPESFEVRSTGSRLDIEYFALNHQGDAPLRYQYRMVRDGTEWSPPTPQRSVTFAYLSPGSYAFQVRAVRPDGAVGQVPAVVSFTVLPAIYARWWFVSGAAALLIALGIVGYRVRVNQLLGVERVRARIATDLHDDIGASLSQIAILAEVARATRPTQGGAAGPDTLARIAETSRSLVDSMSDIVWAINPEVDTLPDLVHRMRRFVEDTLGGSDLDVTFSAPDSASQLRLGADVRREVFLILKESVTNIAKHAGARHASIALRVDGRRLTLEVVDDGRGYDPGGRTDGNGLASMRRRVASLGGQLTVESTAGRGTRIRLDLERA